MSSSVFPSKIEKLIESQHVMSIAVNHDGELWSASCFYAFDRENNKLIFVSDPSTLHARGIIQNSKISGTIANNEKRIRKIKGIQFTGKAYQVKEEYLKKAYKLFREKFAFAFLKKTTFWVIDIEYVKMTDNTYYFSSKTHWKRNT